MHTTKNSGCHKQVLNTYLLGFHVKHTKKRSCMKLSNKWYSSADFWHAKGNSIYKAEEHLGARMRKRGGEKINRD